MSLEILSTAAQPYEKLKGLAIG